MPQGDHKKRAKYRFASKTLMRILPAKEKAEVEGLMRRKPSLSTSMRFWASAPGPPSNSTSSVNGMTQNIPIRKLKVIIVASFMSLLLLQIVNINTLEINH